MENQSGTLTSSQGSAFIGTTPNDTITFTPTGTYTVEYPLGTVAISASTGAQSLSVSGGQLRLTCATGSVTWALSESADEPFLTSTQVLGAQSLVAGVGNAKKTPIPQIGTALSLSDISVVSGAPTITLTTGPNGQPALKVVCAANTNSEITFPALVGSYFYGDAYLIMDGSYTRGNLDYATVYVSQDDASYAKGVNQSLQYALTTPLQNVHEQGGAVTYWFRKSGHSNFGVPTYPGYVGAMKVRFRPVGTTEPATVYIYGFGFAAPSPKGRICVTWDDGYDSMFKLGYDAFASRGIKQTMSVIGSAQDTGGTYSYTRQLKAFVDAGNACVAHGPWPAQGAGNLYSAYPGSANPVSDAVADMNRNRDWLLANGLLVPNADRCYVWPQGTFQASVNDTTLLDAALSNGYTVARCTGNIAGGTLYPRGVQIDAMGKYNRLACPIIGHLWAGTTAAEATNITAITTAIGYLAANGSDAFLMLHRVLPNTTSDGTMGSAGSITIRQSDLETIAAAIKTSIDAGTLEAVTMPQLAGNSWWRGY